MALVQATGPRLAEVLSGQIDPLELLFPGGSNELLESFYTQGGDFPAFNRLIQVAVAKAAEALPPRRAIRVMEVGAGTGSLTRDVLQVLPADSCEYLFTDIGPAFVAAAKKQFADHAGMDYQTFDAEREPQLQNVPRHSLDLILATNVLHATADLKQTLANLRACLAPGGMLIFLEVVRRRPVWDNLFRAAQGMVELYGRRSSSRFAAAGTNCSGNRCCSRVVSAMCNRSFAQRTSGKPNSLCSWHSARTSSRPGAAE